jgi:hypothetical protein
MPKYLFLYRHTQGSMPTEPPSPEQLQHIMTDWNAWIAKFKASGHMAEAGDALTPAGKVLRTGGAVTDGPFVETKEVLGGYSIIQAKSFDEAVTVAKECPAARMGTIEIREFAGWV